MRTRRIRSPVWRHYEPGEPVELDVLDDGEEAFHVEVFFAELERPIYMAVAAADREQSRSSLAGGRSPASRIRPRSRCTQSRSG